VLISVGTAYLVMQFASIMDYVQALFSFFIAPLFGTVVLGMLWKRATGCRRVLGIAVRDALLDRYVDLGKSGSLPRCVTSRCRRTPKGLLRICIRRCGLSSLVW
jgi:SSS family solute:Na+ symporter